MTLLPMLWQSFNDEELDDLEDEVKGRSHYPGREADLAEIDSERDSRRPRAAPSGWSIRPPLRSRRSG